MADLSLIACDTAFNDKISELWRLILRYAGFWIIAIRSQSHAFPVSYELNDSTSQLLAFCNMSVTARFLIKLKVGEKLKVSLTSHEASDNGWNVWHSRLILLSAQL